MKLRVLIVDLSARFGGSNARVLGLMQALPRGVTALGTLQNSPGFEQAHQMGLEVYGIARNKFDPRIAVRLNRIVRRNGFQVLDAQNSQSKFWATLTSGMTGAALVSTLNSWYESEHSGGLKGRVYQGLERATSGRTSVFIAVSEDIRHRLLQEGEPQEKVFLVPNAAPDKIESVRVDAQWLREAFGFPANAVVCSAVGRLEWAKGYKYLVQAIALHPDDRLHCVILGSGSEQMELESLIHEHSLQSRVILAGFRSPDEVFRIVKSSDVFVMPSLSEGTPISILEAAILETPIVASQVGGIPQLIKNGEHALLVEPGDVKQLSEALAYVAGHPDKTAEMARKAKAHVAINFSRKAQVSRTETAYWAALRHG